ncbi:MAG TPA: class II aldolase/adducin family protein [Streptosporangiaceae bacterium]|nr:class II aldolase/adducin family protein [Streptosporangiaceae bacterium]
MYRDDDHDGRRGPAGLREQLVRYGNRLLEDGLAVGSAGNLSVRAGDEVLITPSGIPYPDLAGDDICVLSMDGAPLGGSAEPSSETPMHLAVYAATRARAVVHTHSPEVVALSAVCDELPAIHYAITGLGGPVRVARYTRFGSEDLARAAAAALAGRRAAILGNHGAITYGATLAEAYDRALLLEWLARVHRLACSRGQPRILTDAELDEVTAEMRRRRYGQARQRGEGG